MGALGSIVGALLATVIRPSWWVLALAGFLVRGGVLLVAVPIVVPPTVAGVMSQLAPTILGAVLIGGPNTPVGVVVIVTALILLAFLLVAGGLGAWFDASLVAEACADDDLGLDAEARQPWPHGLGTARLLPHAATAIVLAVAAAQIFGVAYNEATSPGAPTTPFVVRVISQVPAQVIALFVVWLLAEALGGLAVRELLLARDAAERSTATEPRVATATARALRRFVRPSSLLTLLVTDALTLIVAVPGWFAGARAWSQLRLLITDGADDLGVGIGLALFLGVVLGWLVLLGVALAWRSAAWTAVVAGRARAEVEVTATA
jgi:hypothetical protein